MVIKHDILMTVSENEGYNMDVVLNGEKKENKVTILDILVHMCMKKAERMKKLVTKTKDAQRVERALRPVYRNNRMSLEATKGKHNSWCIITTYGSEVWALNASGTSHVESTEMR